MFVVEDRDRAVTSTYVDFFPSHKFIGCGKECEEMKELIEFTEQLVSKDFTSEMDFLGLINLLLEDNIKQNNILSISGCQLGIQRPNLSLIYAEELVGSTIIKLDPNAYGLYIPWDQLINRLNLQWFVRLSPEQVLESNTMIGNCIRNNI